MNNDNNDKINIKQINNQTPTELERIVLEELKKEKQTEELSKTKQFTLLNSRNKNNDFELPKPKQNLSDTIKLKLSDLRAKIDEQNIELPTLKPKKSLYDTVIIRLDDLINKKNAIKRIESKKITNIEEVSSKNKYRTKDKINVDSEYFGKKLYYLNKVAIKNLKIEKNHPVRRYTNLSKLTKIDKIKISKENYKEYQNKLNKFAINKLYYKIAPKETNSYRIYKYSLIISLTLILIATINLGNWLLEGKKTKNLTENIHEFVEITETTSGKLFNIEDPTPSITPSDEEENEDENPYWHYLNTPLTSVDFDKLTSLNEDTKAWLIVNNTNVNYPVVQGEDNDFYLTHSFDKSYNTAGWVFADYRTTFDTISRNTIVYAHGRKDQVMFGSLTKTLESEWHEDQKNQIVQFSTLKYNTMWQIFSIYTTEAETYYLTHDFGSDESFKEYLKEMQKRSIYDFKVNLNNDDKILTLSTCYNDNGIRLVIQAKLVKIEER